MSREQLDRWCERGILGLVLAILVFAPLATGAVRTLEFLIVQGLTIGVAILWLVRLWSNPRLQLLWPPVCWLVSIFTTYVIARYLTSDLEYVARLEMVRVLVYAILFLAIVNNLHRQEHMRLILLTLVFLAMLIASYAIYQFATGSQQVWHFTTPYQKRGTGTFISPNNLAGFLEMILPLGLAWILVSRAGHLNRIFVSYAALVILAGIVVSGSRGGWIATGLVLLTFFAILIARRTHRIPALVLFAVVLAAGVYFVPRMTVFQARVQQLTQDGQLSDGRMDMWAPAMMLWRENVLWGIGPNHFNYRFRQYRPESQQRDPDRVHNDYLNTLTDWGLVGAAIVASALALLLAGAVRTGRSVQRALPGLGNGQSNKFAIVLGASMGLLAILLHSFTDFNLHVPSNAILAITLMALLAGSQRFATDDYWITIRKGLRIGLTIVLLSGVVYLLCQGTRRSREYVWLAEARRLERLTPIPTDRLTDALERAFTAEPRNSRTAYQIGETYRIQSWAGMQGYEAMAETAIKWFDRSIRLNPYDGYGYLRYGMCLDWLDRMGESQPYYDRAVELDPNGYFTAANVGWHYVQTGDLAAARNWLERSRRLQSKYNDVADRRLPIVVSRMLEAATNRGPRFGAPMTEIEPFEVPVE